MSNPCPDGICRSEGFPCGSQETCIIQAAQKEFAQEQFREAVEVAKERIRRRHDEPLWKRLIPFTVKIERRK